MLTYLGPALFQLRLDAGLSQQHAASALGAPSLHAQISRWERNLVIPEFPFLLRLLAVYDATLGDLAAALDQKRTAPRVPALKVERRSASEVSGRLQHLRCVGIEHRAYKVAPDSFDIITVGRAER